MVDCPAQCGEHPLPPCAPVLEEGGRVVGPAYFLTHIIYVRVEMTVRPTPCNLRATPYTLHPTPCTLRPPRSTLHPTPYVLHPTTSTLHPPLYALHPRPYALDPTPCTLHSPPSTLHPPLYALHPRPYALHPTPYTLHPKLSTLNQIADPTTRYILGNNTAANEYGTHKTVKTRFWPRGQILALNLR